MDFDPFKVSLDNKRRQDRVKQKNEENEKRQAEYSSIQDRYFKLLKDFTILSGTVFGSSLALSVGKKPIAIFIIGELFIFFSVIIGILILWTELKNLEWSYMFDIKNKLESDKIMNKDIMEDFELKTTNELIETYDKLMKNNQLSFRRVIYKKIKPETFPTIFFTCLIIGSFLLLLSII